MRLLYVTRGGLDRYLTRAIQELGHMIEVVVDLEDGVILAAMGGWQAVVYDAAAPAPEDVRRLANACPHASLIVFAAADDASVRIATLRAGADAWFARPYQFTEVSAKLDALARRKAPVGEGAPFELLPAERAARLDGERLMLSRREYALLALLAERAGEVVPTEAILEAVWGDEAEARAELVRNHISRLRAILERGRPWRLLHAVRGHGYVFRIERRPT